MLMPSHSREQFVEKFVEDVEDADRAAAEEEADRFYMDSELVNAYIKYQKDKDKIDFGAEVEGELGLDDPKTIATYAAWIIGGAGFSYIRKNFIEPKYESGEWEPIHIDIGGFMGKPVEDMAIDAATTAAPDAVVDAAVDAAAPVLDATADAVSSSM